MTRCKNCGREIVNFGVSLGAMPEEEIEKIKKKAESEGTAIVFNASPFEEIKTCQDCMFISKKSKK